MIANSKDWLMNYYKLDRHDVEAYFQNEDVTGFLISWIIFEQKLFGGFATGKKIKNYKNPESEILVRNLKN